MNFKLMSWSLTGIRQVWGIFLCQSFNLKHRLIVYICVRQPLSYVITLLLIPSIYRPALISFFLFTMKTTQKTVRVHARKEIRNFSTIFFLNVNDTYVIYGLFFGTRNFFVLMVILLMRCLM